MAQHSSAHVRIRLERPFRSTPNGAHALAGGGLELTHAGTNLARAIPVELKLEVPAPPSYLQRWRRRDTLSVLPAPDSALLRLRHRARARRRPAVVCRPLDASNVVAAPWVADPSLSMAKQVRRSSSVRRSTSGAFAASDDMTPMLLGEFTAHIDRCVHIDGRACGRLAHQRH